MNIIDNNQKANKFFEKKKNIKNIYFIILINSYINGCNININFNNKQLY